MLCGEVVRNTCDLDTTRGEKTWNTIIEHRMMIRAQHKHIWGAVVTGVIAAKRTDVMNLNIKRIWYWLDTKIAATHLTGKAI